MPYATKLLIEGERACFTRPELKAERVSYDVITPSAARNILQSIYWKPAIDWIINRIHVLKPIRFQTIRRNEVGDKILATKVRAALTSGDLSNLYLPVEGSRAQRATTHLTNVAYLIEAHFVLTPTAPASETRAKHQDIFNRRASRGQCFQQPFLGNREFPAQFRLLTGNDPVPPAINDSRDLGIMFYDFDYPANRSPTYFRARIENGIIDIPAPNSPEVLR